MRIPRMVWINFRVRTLAFAWSFVVIGLILWERGAGIPAWGLAALQFLAYPQLLWLLASRARDPRAAELRNLYLDPLLLGAWIAALGFPTWPAYGAVFATALNNAVIRGWHGAGLSVVAFASGAYVMVAARGFMHYPGTGDLVTLLCFSGSIAYACSIGVVVRRQNDRLRGARDELRASEARYRLIAENAGDLIGMVDLDGRWRYASPSYGRLLGSQDLHDGADAFRAVADEDQFRVRAAVKEVMQGGDTCRLRLRLHALGDHVVRLETLVHAVKDDTGAITGAVMVSRDITAAYLREEQLEVAALAFERMAEAIVITGADGRILTVNRAYAQITGFAAAEVVGQPEAEFRGAMQPEAFYDDLYAEVEKSGHWSGMTWSRRRDGTLYRESRSVSAVRDADGRLTHTVSLFRELNGGHAGARSA